MVYICVTICVYSTCDNKGGLVCALHAMSRLRPSTISGTSSKYAHSRLTLDFGSVALACVADEESGACSQIGLRHLLDLEALDSPKGAIYTYPNYNITIGHRGLLRVVITILGESVHTGSSRWYVTNRMISVGFVSFLT